MTPAAGSAFETLREKLDAAVRGSDAAGITQEVKAALQDALKRNALVVPPQLHRTRPDTYARRLWYRDPDGRYTAVVMTWGPGQKTGLHDHAGIWCVECVVDGEMEVAQYDLLSQSGGDFRFEERTRVRAGRGSAGCLIPPFEYHTLGNARADQPAITLHVYGGDMDHCHVFEPRDGGAYGRVRKALGYHD